ncbi:MAG: hypothetical protein H7831_11905 [Magnetococcus sp. WYHC-3]
MRNNDKFKINSRGRAQPFHTIPVFYNLKSIFYKINAYRAPDRTVTGPNPLVSFVRNNLVPPAPASGWGADSRSGANFDFGTFPAKQTIHLQESSISVATRQKGFPTIIAVSMGTIDEVGAQQMRQ